MLARAIIGTDYQQYAVRAAMEIVLVEREPLGRYLSGTALNRSHIGMVGIKNQV